MARFTWSDTVTAALKRAETLMVLAPRHALDTPWAAATFSREIAERIAVVSQGLAPGALGATATSLDPGAPRRIVVAALPSSGSRHNSPTRLEAICKCVTEAKLSGRVALVLALEKPASLPGSVVGVVRSFPLFQRKTDADAPPRIAMTFVDTQGRAMPVGKFEKELAESVAWAARTVDTPTAQMTTADFAKEARAVVKGLSHCSSKVIVGKDLVDAGLGGIFGVGRAAEVSPRLLILDYRPPKAVRTVALVGKGVVYDTGGLHLKARGSMETMKADMGGAAAVVGAFRVLAATKSATRVIALAPLAENAISEAAYRPDDILTLHSGHTVEINNTDAEGRLLLADAVSFAARKLGASVVIDAATLTGAQSIATGYRHAAVVSNRQGLEDLAVEAGRRSGDLTFPLPFAPEFYQAEFKSQVADMKNSVKNRSNAQSSCAAQFVYSHIDDLDTPWLHIDLAGPAFRDDRATGFGVHLLCDLVEHLEARHLEA